MGRCPEVPNTGGSGDCPQPRWLFRGRLPFRWWFKSRSTTVILFGLEQEENSDTCCGTSGP